MVKGEVLLSVADIDLVYLNLGLLLSSVKTVEQTASRDGNGAAKLISWQTSAQDEFLDTPLLEMAEEDEPSVTPQTNEAAGLEAMLEIAEEDRPSLTADNSPNTDQDGETVTRPLPSVVDHGSPRLPARKAGIDQENVEKGLTKLVLTLVDLIRKLMEKQAVRRIDAGQLEPGEIERLGNAFFLLNEQIEKLKKAFGLEDEDLNLDLGPLGELL
jgi:Gas vesicle protein K